MANDPKVTWKTTGRKLDQPEDPLPSIDITEYLRSVSMDAGTEPYGIAVDAPLAVSMIKALWEKVSQEPSTNTLRQMLEGSYGITFDKNVLLKTISQAKW